MRNGGHRLPHVFICSVSQGPDVRRCGVDGGDGAHWWDCKIMCLSEVYVRRILKDAVGVRSTGGKIMEVLGQGVRMGGTCLSEIVGVEDT